MEGKVTKPLNQKFTPDFITELGPNDIFVFGSNLAGAHDGGAARLARQKFGAIMGQGVGLQGNSYAIPTMQGGIETIKPYVDEFIEFAKDNPDLTFYVTKIGCGIAGFNENDIAPLFKKAMNVSNIRLPEDFVDILKNKEKERFKDKVVVVTGGAKGIGKRIVERFRNEGAKVEIIDKIEGDWFVGDIADKRVLEDFVLHVINKYGRADILVNNALPLMKGIDECTWEEFVYAQKVGVSAPFYLSKLFKDYFSKGSSIINISSSRDRMSQPQTESYAAAKGGISALTHALAMSLAPKVRVNSISPGWIDTIGYDASEEDRKQQPVGRIGNPDDIASMVLFLCSDEAGFITGENIVIDGGMTRQMIYHGDNGWKLEK